MDCTFVLPGLEAQSWSHSLGGLSWRPWFDLVVLRLLLRGPIPKHLASESGFGWGWIFALIDNQIDEDMNRQDILCIHQNIVSAAVKNIYAFKKESDNLSFAILKMFAYCSFAVSLRQFQCLLDEY